MSVKSESKKAALKAAKKASVLPVLVGLISLLADAWTKEGTEGYPALNLAPKQKQRVLNKWAQIIRWQGAVIRQQNMLGKVCGNNAVHREMDAKHRLIEAAMLDHSKSAPE